MHEIDISALEEGSVIGISAYGRVRVPAVVEKAAEGVIIARAINGQYRIAFLASEPRPGTFLARRAKDWRDGETLNGSWARGLRIAFAGDLTQASRAALLRADEAMRGRSTAAMKRAYIAHEQAFADALAFMNDAVEAAQDPMPCPGP